MLTRRSFVRSSALGLGMVAVSPSISFGEEVGEEAANEDIVSLLSSCLKAGASAERLKKSSKDIVKIDYSALSQASFSKEWAKSSALYLESLLAATPQTLSVDEEDSFCGAQADAISYAADRAAWSVGKGRASDFGSETVYMYLSHYIDVGSNYWNAGNVEYLKSGQSRSDVQPYYAQWLQPSDRASYGTYLKATAGTAKIGDVANVASGLFSGAKFLKEDAVSAMKSFELSKDANDKACIVLGLMAEEQLLESASNDFVYLTASFIELINSKQDFELSVLADTFRGEDYLKDKYKDTTKALLENAAIAVGGAFFLGGGLAGMLGTAASSAISTAAVMSAYMASDFFSRTAWLVMRYGWSGRYAERLSERLYS